MKRLFHISITVLCIILCCLTASAETQLSNQFQVTPMSPQKALEVYQSLEIRQTAVEYSGHELISGFDVDPEGRIAVSLPHGKYGYFNIYDAEMNFSYSFVCKLRGKIVLLFSEDPECCFFIWCVMSAF